MDLYEERLQIEWKKMGKYGEFQKRSEKVR